MTPSEYLREKREAMPDWLAQFTNGNAFPRQAFLSSRIVYYPGSGTDGHPVKLFGSAHAAHCFVYVDYGRTQAELEKTLEHPEHGFLGYHRLARVPLRESDLVPNGWRSHLAPDELNIASALNFASVADAPFGFLEVLERNPDLAEEHGAKRLAILFLGADGIASYDALFCQGHEQRPPFAVVLVDHGFGGNYERFGRDGLLERIAQRCGVFPEFLLVAEYTQAWTGFERVPAVERDRGGMHNERRYLFAQNNEEKSASRVVASLVDWSLQD
ncbi:MAG: hypothetical protein HYZ17_03035 [Betaproteobacteria bacterium]|nr:hypothetical protein [Betaproteobacteria bacterium]